MFKRILITFLAAIFTLTVFYGSYTIYAAFIDVEEEEPDYYHFFQTPSLGYNIVNLSYHSVMNDYFDEYIEKLVDILDEDDFQNNPDFNTPYSVDLTNYKIKCGEDNVSTFCVSMGALDLYISYVESLYEIKVSLPFMSWYKNAETIFSEMENRNIEIDKEIENAKAVMESTIKAYDEFRLAYPMHLKYEKIINSLNKYKIALAKIKGQINYFPLKFIDATSSECK